MTDLQVKDGRFIGCRGAEGGYCQVGFQRCGRCEQLGGNGAVCLVPAVSIAAEGKALGRVYKVQFALSRLFDCDWP